MLLQQTKALQAERSEAGAAAVKLIESIQHLLWRANVDEALDRIDSLFMDLDLIARSSAPAPKLATGIGEFRTYIRNNRGALPNFGERYRQGQTISSAFVESTFNHVVSRWSRQTPADEFDAERSASAATDADEGPQQRTR